MMPCRYPYGVDKEESRKDKNECLFNALKDFDSSRTFLQAMCVNNCFQVRILNKTIKKWQSKIVRHFCCCCWWLVTIMENFQCFKIFLLFWILSLGILAENFNLTSANISTTPTTTIITTTNAIRLKAKLLLHISKMDLIVGERVQIEIKLRWNINNVDSTSKKQTNFFN